MPVSQAAQLTPEELGFCEFSMLVDDPKRLEEYENTFRDPDYEAFEKAFDEEIRREQEAESLMRKSEAEQLAAQGYDVPAEQRDDEEWERVD